VSADERVIVFATSRSGNRNLWYSTRVAAGDPFDPPAVVPMLNVATDDGATLSFDGCRLYFVSDRNGNDDIYVTSVQ